MVLEPLSREFRTGASWELLYTTDLIIMMESAEEYIRKLLAWKRGMEAKGARVNMKKFKIFLAVLFDIVR